METAESKGRIVVSAISEMSGSFFEKGERAKHFKVIAHPPLGYGISGYDGTEAQWVQTAAFFIKAAKEEGARVFILGFAPRTIPWLWIKTAELISEGAKAKEVLIPVARSTGGIGGPPLAHAGILHVTQEGISADIKTMQDIRPDDFWAEVAKYAMSLNAPVSAGSVPE